MAEIPAYGTAVKLTLYGSEADGLRRAVKRASCALPMPGLSKTCAPNEVEERWYQRWLDDKAFVADPARVSEKRPAYSIVIPPPNVTGILTLGHVLNNTIQDILCRRARMLGKEVLLISLLLAWTGASLAEDFAIQKLATEVKTLGWIIFSARAEAGDWDLFACRPDGSQKRNLTNTPDYNEAYALLSRDGTRMIYRRTQRNENIDGNRHGEQGEPVLSRSDGTGAKVLGAEGALPWASWSPDGKQIATLSIKGIAFIDLATGQTVRTLKRNGFFQQLTWSPDGEWLSGVSNSFGTSWSDARMNVATGTANAVSREDCCTPDWFPDSRRMIFSSRQNKEGNNGYGWTQLWMANGDGTDSRVVFAEDGRHIYGGHVSPDGKYVLFTGNAEEDGDSGRAGSPMGLMRFSDAPIVGGESNVTRSRFPQAKSGPVLKLPVGWGPSWTFYEFFPSQK